MTVNPENILTVLGYRVDTKGNVTTTNNQLAIISLQPTEEGGILRIHGSSDSFFYSGEEDLEFDLTFPTKVSSKYVFFHGGEDGFKISRKEFTENMLKALAEYNDIVKRNLAG